MRISDAFPSKYVKASDLPAAKFVRLRVERVVLEDVGESDSVSKPVMYFQKATKGLVLNKTNSQIIADAYGDETDGWRSREVLLYVTDTTYQGRPTPCIRVKIPAPGSAPGAGSVAKAAPPAPPAPSAPPAHPEASGFEAAADGDHGSPVEPGENEIPF